MTELNISNIATASETFTKPLCLLSIASIKQPFLLDNLKSILGLYTLALLYRIGSCRNEETIDNENSKRQLRVHKTKKKQINT
jgi:hypothetical protein